MRKTFIVFVIIAGLFACQQTFVDKKESRDSNKHLVMATLWYQRASECRALYYQAFNIARLSLDKQLATGCNNSKPKAVVVDIDETILDNSPFETNMIRSGKTFSSAAWKEWTDMSKARATPGSLAFLKYAESKGVEIFYISNRDTSATRKTLENLKVFGFPFADKDHMLLRTNTGVKTKRRNKVKETHEILILIGDNIGDFDEILEDRSKNYGFALVDSMKQEFGKRFIVLPNPMYGSWEGQVLKSDRSLSIDEKEQIRIQCLIGYEEI